MQSSNFCINCDSAVSGNFCASCGAKSNSSSGETTSQTSTVPPQATGLAIASLITSFFIAPIGLIMGIIAKNEISNSKGEKGGEGLAIAAIIISSLTIFIWICVIAFFVYQSSTSYY